MVVVASVVEENCAKKLVAVAFRRVELAAKKFVVDAVSSNKFDTVASVAMRFATVIVLNVAVVGYVPLVELGTE